MKSSLPEADRHVESDTCLNDCKAREIPCGN